MPPTMAYPIEAAIRIATSAAPSERVPAAATPSADVRCRIHAHASSPVSNPIPTAQANRNQSGMATPIPAATSGPAYGSASYSTCPGTNCERAQAWARAPSVKSSPDGHDLSAPTNAPSSRSPHAMQRRNPRHGRCPSQGINSDACTPTSRLEWRTGRSLSAQSVESSYCNRARGTARGRASRRRTVVAARSPRSGEALTVRARPCQINSAFQREPARPSQSEQTFPVGAAALHGKR